jgi:hypothetical protein
MTPARATKAVAVTPAPVAVLQRKCACGTKTTDEACPQCQAKEKEGSGVLQRSPARGGDVGAVPAVVHEVLREPGRPLDGASRTFFEPRFGADFSGVRVHTDAKAAESARAVRASAYTVGQDVVFAEGRYDVQSRAGKRLLGHELGHTLQQPETVPTAGLRIGPPVSSSEVEAEHVGEVVSQGGFIRPSLRTPAQLARDIPIPENLDPEERQRAEDYLLERRLRQQRRLRGEDEESAKSEQPAAPAGPVNHAGRPLTEPERARIQGLIPAAAPPGGGKSIPAGPRFVLHDTAARVTGRTESERQKKEQASLERHRSGARGPLDEAAAAYVPAAGPAVVARPDFFDSRRPTASEYERRADLISQADREAAFQAVWGATKPAERTAALGSALSGLELTPAANEGAKQQQERADRERKMTPAEVKSEQGTAERELASPLPAHAKPTDKPHIHTTGSWAVGAICDRLKTTPVKQLADGPEAEKKLQDGCNKLAAYFTARDPRLGSEVNVEVIQEKGPPCDISPKAKPADVPKLSKPAYTSDQYRSLVLLYLQAALEAGQFPEITTHFWVDRVAGDHCDPRCFDLPHLYELIAAALGHAKGSTYGLQPQYGTKQGTDNVWWHDIACGGPHP